MLLLVTQSLSHSDYFCRKALVFNLLTHCLKNLISMDMALSIGFFAIVALFGSLDFSVIFAAVPFMNESAITIIGLLLLGGAMAKSSQIPLHSWLPGSMEGSLRLKTYFFLIFGFILGFYLINQYLVYLYFDYFYSDFIDIFNCNSMFFLFIRGFARARDDKGRFFKAPGSAQELKPLSNKLLEALSGELLGDGHIRFNKKGEDGLPKPNTLNFRAAYLFKQ